MTINERALYIYTKCRQAGMTYAGAIGTLGNLQGETHDFDPMSCETSYLNRFGLTDAEYTRRADNDEVIYNGKKFTKDSAGYGIAQWTYHERKQNLLDFAKANGKSVGDLDLQIAFMIKEMTGHYTPTWKIVSTTNSISEAVKICVTNYEKPANQSEAIQRRTGYANNWAKIIKDGDEYKEEVKTPETETSDTPITTTGYDRKKIIALAESEVGYLEKKTDAYLDDKTANAGSNNYTKYARDLDAISGFYNGKKQGHAWCDVFVDWLFVKCFGVEAALDLLCAHMGSSGAGCTYSLNYYIRKNQFFKRGESKPQVGDQIFFGAVGNSSHTGIVYKVDNSKVYTIEGNTSGASGVVANGGGVCKKSYSLGYSSIAGYGRPNYGDGFVGDSVDTSTVQPEKPKDETKKDTTTTNLRELEYGMTGDDVKKAQELLIAKGYSVGADGADGDFGQNTYYAVVAFQKANGLDADGIIGANTWVKLLVEDKKKEEETKPKQDNIPAPAPSKTQFDRQKLLDVALAEVGYYEKKSESQLDDKTANGGIANFNKYARDLDAIKNYYYHDRKQGLNWCDIFCDWCFVQAYGLNDSFTVNCQPQYSYGAGCPQSAAYYKAQNRFDLMPQVGDQFFISDGADSTGHTGLVLEVHDDYIVSIEGNQAIKNGVDGVVKKRRYKGEFYGFGHPAYNDGYGTDDYIGDKAEVVEPAPEEPKPIQPEKKDEPIVEEKATFTPPTLKFGDTGIEVKKFQHLLVYCGIPIGNSGVDGKFGYYVSDAVKLVQSKIKRPINGIADEYVWAWLINA